VKDFGVGRSRRSSGRRLRSCRVLRTCATREASFVDPGGRALRSSKTFSIPFGVKVLIEQNSSSGGDVEGGKKA